MWFVMLVLGALLGGLVANGAGAVVGGFFGALIGWSLAQKRAAEKDERLEAIEQRLRALSARLDAIERRQSFQLTQTEHSGGEKAAAVAATPEPAPEAFSSPPAELPPAREAPLAADLPPLRETPAPSTDRVPDTPYLPPAASPAIAKTPADAPPSRRASASAAATRTSGAGALLVGLGIGALVGVSNGLPGMLVGAGLGLLVVYLVQSQNARAARDGAQYDGLPREAQEEAPAPAPAPAEVASLTAEAAAAQHAADSAEPAVELEPTFFGRLFSGNIVAKLGVLILFIGVGFLLKYAYDQGRLPVQVRLAAVGLVAAGMLYGGWRLIPRRRLYGLILQGCGIGLLYLDVFFALRVYGLVEPITGFAAFMALGVAATLLAVRQDAKVLAVLGLTGAFLAPILAGSRSGNHVLLFSYYTLLNGFILGISWFKAWRDLNLVGFIFTFAVGVLWGANNYRPELFGSVEPFVLIFFAMYLVIPILFAQRQPPELRGLVDGTLVFGTPICAAFMQAGLVRDMPYGLAWSAGVAAALYAVLAATTIRRDRMVLLGETYVALAVVFLTLAIFFAFDAYPTFALWTLEGAAIIWVGLRQERVLARLFGFALQLAGTAYFLLEYPKYSLANPWWNEFVLGCAVIAAAGFIIAWLCHKYAERRSQLEPNDAVVLVWAAVWWSVAGVHALYHAYGWGAFTIGLLAFTAATVAAVELIGARLEWPALRKIARAHLLALFAIAVLIALQDRARLEFVRPLAHGGYWAWPLNLLLFFWVYARHVRDGLVFKGDLTYGLAWLLIAGIATWDAAWLLDRHLYGQAIIWGAAGIVAACVRFRLRERGNAEALPVAIPVLLWGLAFWFVSALSWIDRDVGVAKPAAVLAFFALSCAAFESAGVFVQWHVLRRAGAALIAGLAFALLLQFARGSHPLADYGWVAWPLAIGLFYWVLRRHERDGIAPLAPVQHVTGLWLCVAVLAWEAAWQLDAFGFGKPWVTATYGLWPAAALALVSSFDGRTSWPFGAHYRSVYRDAALGGLVVYLVAWALYANLSLPGDMRPLPYLPVLNPLDIATIAAFVAVWRWWRTLEVTNEENRRTVLGLFIVSAFIWVNCVMLRTFHYWAGVEYELAALARSVLVQSAFSLLWTASAFVLMLYATREQRRQLWMIGAALIGVVVLKLFLNDLSNTGTVARIVSFIGVGAGLLVIGYVAPVPPGDVERQAD